MTDKLTVEKRSWNMSRIPSENTKPEIIVRSVLHKLGFRFRKNVRTLAGKPDVVLPKYKTIIMVHGCFWHQHKGCKLAHTPKSNKKYWKEKLTRNVERDKRNQASLSGDGWNVVTVWECQVSDIESLAVTLRDEISAPSI